MYAKARIGLLALVALFVLLPSAGKSQSRQRMAVPEDMERWIKTVFAKGHVPPFSFVYDGKPSAQFIRKWKYSASKGASDEAGTIKYLFTYTDPVTGLKVACRVTGFEEFGAVEWMLYFTNTSQHNSAMLTDVKVTDFGMEAGKDASFTLHHAVEATAVATTFGRCRHRWKRTSRSTSPPRADARRTIPDFRL